MKENQKKIYMKYENREYKKNTKLEVKIVENAVVLPAKQDFSTNPKLWAIGGVMDKNNNFVEESASSYLFGGEYEYNEDYIDNIDEEVVFFGPFIKHWGHFLCDQMSRLWYVINEPEKYKIVYCGWNWNQGISDISGNYLELFELLGIKKEQLINIQKPTRFRKIIIPEFSFIPDKYYSEEFEKLTDIIVKNVKSHIKKCPEKIYLTRQLLNENNGKERGESKIIQYLENKGYRIISPEKLSLSDQIFYLNHAKIICMISGSISHNLMFCKQENEVVILNKTDMINAYQMVIDHMTKTNITYVNVYKRIFPVLFGMGPFLVYISKYFQNWGGKIKEINRISMADYFWYFRKYFEIYSNKNNRKLLKIQNSNTAGKS